MINPQSLATIQYEVYDADDRLQGTASVDLPDLEYATTDIKGAGIAGTVSWPVKANFENFVTTIHWRNLTPMGAKYLSQNSAYNLCFRQATEIYDAGTGERPFLAVRIDLRCHTNKLALGTLEPGEVQEVELEVMVDRIKITIDGKEVLLVDKFNFVNNVNGTDELSDIRAALGY